jgi:ankyrin repeat protein
MAQARALQTPQQILAFAKENKWQDIRNSDDALINAAVKLKSLALLEPIINQEFDMALRRAIVSKAPYPFIVLLIAHRVNINSGSAKQFNRTSLHFAAQLGMTDVIKALVGAGAYVNMIDTNYFSPAHLACQHGHSQAALLLANLGAYNVGNESPVKLVPRGKEIEFAAYDGASLGLTIKKMLLPSGANSKYATLIQPNNALAAFSHKKILKKDEESSNATLEGMLSEGREGSYEKVIDLYKQFNDVMPDHLTGMLLRYGNFNNDNLLISCPQHKMTKITNLAFQWADLEALSNHTFTLTFRGSDMDSFFLLSEANDLSCTSKFIREAKDGKLVIDNKNLSDAIIDLKRFPILKKAEQEPGAPIKLRTQP